MPSRAQWKDIATEAAKAALILAILERLYLTSNASWLEARAQPCALLSSYADGGTQCGTLSYRTTSITSACTRCSSSSGGWASWARFARSGRIQNGCPTSGSGAGSADRPGAEPGDLTMTRRIGNNVRVVLPPRACLCRGAHVDERRAAVESTEMTHFKTLGCYRDATGANSGCYRLGPMLLECYEVC